MTMPASGTLNLAGTSSPVSVAQELGLGLTTSISMEQSNVRTLAGVGGTGTSWSMNTLYGKSNRVALSYTFSSSTANAALNVSSISGYSSGKSDITITVNSGVYLYATSTSNAGLTLTGGSTGDTITLVNNGFIMGQGGRGRDYSGASVTAGGNALSLGFNTTVNNTNASAYIGGGGGGGGTEGGGRGGGGGAGGGTGGTGRYCCCGNVSYPGGGGGGGPGASGANSGSAFGGGGGGRIFPGNAATASGVNGIGGQAGGAGASSGNGGGSNNAGSAGGFGGGGGGWGASGGGSGAAGGGKAVALNGKSVTWVSGNTTRVWGTVS